MKRLVLILILLPNLCSAGMFGSSNFWECILDEMPGVKNDPAARAVIRKCRKKHPSLVVKKKRDPIFGTKTAGDCIIKYGKDVSSPLGAKRVQEACYRLYKKR